MNCSLRTFGYRAVGALAATMAFIAPAQATLYSFNFSSGQSSGWIAYDDAIVADQQPATWWGLYPGAIAGYRIELRQVWDVLTGQYVDKTVAGRSGTVSIGLGEGDGGVGTCGVDCVGFLLDSTEFPQTDPKKYSFGFYDPIEPLPSDALPTSSPGLFADATLLPPRGQFSLDQPRTEVVRIDVVPEVPEASTLGMFASGLVLLAAVLRRRCGLDAW